MSGTDILATSSPGFTQRNRGRLRVRRLRLDCGRDDNFLFPGFLEVERRRGSWRDNRSILDWRRLRSGRLLAKSEAETRGAPPGVATGAATVGALASSFESFCVGAATCVAGAPTLEASSTVGKSKSEKSKAEAIAGAASEGAVSEGAAEFSTAGRNALSKSRLSKSAGAAFVAMLGAVLGGGGEAGVTSCATEGVRSSSSLSNEKLMPAGGSASSASFWP